jgi:hypothetical protein
MSPRLNWKKLREREPFAIKETAPELTPEELIAAFKVRKKANRAARIAEAERKRKLKAPILRVEATRRRNRKKRLKAKARKAAAKMVRKV